MEMVFEPEHRPLPASTLLAALRAVRRGDFGARLPLGLTGVSAEIAEAFNDVIDLNERMVHEFERMSTAVGREGRINERVSLGNVGGAWATCVDAVNRLVSDLVQPTVDVARVIGAVAEGNLSMRMALEVDGRPIRGEFFQTARTVNTMVEQLGGFASEVTRVAREVGTEGKLGGQAEVAGVAGTWKDLTDHVNFMAANLTSQVRNIADVTTAVANGDLSKKITVDVKGEILELKNTINTMVDQLNSFASEVTRVAREVGTEGKLGGQAQVKGVAGTWKDLTDNVNGMAANLTGQVRNIAEVTTAVANGDLSRKITVDVQGEILQLKNTINTMVDQLNSFASEVTRVAREVGTEGKLGGQAQVKGVAGTWKDLTDNVNSMASNLTSQVRGIAKVVTGVANGNLKQKLAVEAKGEMAELASTINEMIDTLAIFADQVTSVAREVGTEGKLGGQARVPGAAGIWRDLTDNVNQLTATLTTQVRAIAEVATAVTKGDLSRSITMQAQGEIAALKDNVNEMIFNLKDTTRKNTETDWLKTNLAKFTRMLQGQRNLIAVAQMILSELARVVDAQHGVFYVMDAPVGAEPELRMLASYAYKRRRGVPLHFGLGEGLVGQCAVEKTRILLTDVPGNYIQISSGLGSAPPQNIIVLPVLFEGEVKAVIELASFNGLSDIHLTFLEQLTEGIGINLNTLSAIMRTEELLKQSQTLTQELQTQQEELKRTNERLEQQAATLRESEELLRNQQEELRNTNEQLEEKARLLAEQKAEVEAKNREVEVAKEALEDKADQLALTSKYKSQFLANMSHELRTPLNSLLILARLLADNERGNLSPKQVEFAKTIHAAGSDLLALINEILDLSKIESGTMSVDLGMVPVHEVRDYVESSFKQVAVEKGLDFLLEVSPELPREIHTDAKRLQQVVKNLLSNAFKFTSRGSVVLRMVPATSGWSPGRATLDQAQDVIAVSVTDTGIGIPADKQRIIFEAFQQADMTTSRKFGGTGLGLSISREIAQLLGGELRVESTLGQGSSFILYLPQPCPVGNGVAPMPTTISPQMVTPDVMMLPTQTVLHDDRDAIHPGDRVILVIEDDLPFAGIMLDMVREYGFKAVIATKGETGFELARQYQPDAITLDVQLPDMDGFTLLEKLRGDAKTSQTPIYMISATDGSREKAMRLGATGMLEKPVSADSLQATLVDLRDRLQERVRRLLVVEDDKTQRENLVDVLAAEDVEVVGVATGEETLQALRTSAYDCVVVDLGLPDMSGAELLQKIREELGLSTLPIIVYTARDLSEQEEADLRRLSETIIMKDVRSRERLLDETELFLRRTPKKAAADPKAVADGRTLNRQLAGRRVLVVDDDVRNIFALTSVLERQQMEVRHATNGLDAIQVLKDRPDVDVVLMDIMMPGMDGYDTMRSIRRMERFKTIPIIALTAKAMKGDREKCLDAGASDYVPKPVDTDQLLSLLRAWLEV